jgi:hypothetical protein
MSDDEKFDLVANLGTKLEVLQQKMSDFMVKTDEYRAMLCEKMKELKESNSDMRKFCASVQDKKAQTYNHLFITLAIPIISLIFACGILFQRIVFLEKVSYGYKDAMSESITSGSHAR